MSSTAEHERRLTEQNLDQREAKFFFWRNWGIVISLVTIAYFATMLFSDPFALSDRAFSNIGIGLIIAWVAILIAFNHAHTEVMRARRNYHRCR